MRKWRIPPGKKKKAPGNHVFKAHDPGAFFFLFPHLYGENG
jgi:hypothetical protein